MENFGTAMITYMAFMKLNEGMSDHDSDEFSNYFDELITRQVAYVDIIPKLHKWKDSRCA